MSSNVTFRKQILIVIIVFTVAASAGLVQNSIKSLRLDREHVTLLKQSKSIDREISNSRIFLDDYYFFGDTTKMTGITTSFENAKNHVAFLDTFITDRYGDKNGTELHETLNAVQQNIEELQQKVLFYLQRDVSALDIGLLSRYHDFQLAYREFDRSIDNYVLNENQQFKQRIFVLLLVIFGLLILSLILVHKLINSYNAVEKRQAEKSIEVEFKERKRIAGDLHDGLGSILSSIALYTKIIEKDCEREVKNNNLVKVKELSTLALDHLEAAINNLNPSMLNRYGLVEALRIVCRNIEETGEIACTLKAKNLSGKFDKNLEINLYRIANELINNTLKHSGASKLQIEFKKVKNILHFSYLDNGKGFNPDLIATDDEEKMGLQNIIQRVESLGGKYDLSSEENKGVEVNLRFKIEKK